jgi:beta-glucanase (GH16 family)
MEQRIYQGIITLLFIVTNTTFQAQMAWNLVWSEEFSGDALNEEVWNYEIGFGNSGWGNNELQYYRSGTNNLVVADGKASITAKQENFGSAEYTSARVQTKGKYDVQYGRIEARIKLPMGQGIWPAFWMLGSNIDEVGWPRCGEIDIMEHVNNEMQIHGTIHWDNNGHQYQGGSISTDPTQFHNYAIEWDADQLRWYLDGILYYTRNIGAAQYSEFHEPFFFIMNIAVGGNWPGSPDNTTVFPAVMEVDFIRVYEWSELPTTVEVNNNKKKISIVINNNQIQFSHLPSSAASIQVYDVSGKLVQTIDTNGHTYAEVPNLTKGMYLVQLMNTDKEPMEQHKVVLF